MAWKGNYQAPDDQVLDKLLKEGGWLEKVSLGWLPVSYLRTMPAYYRGVVPVIEHDHGSAPGINGGHSETKPKYPPVKDMELCRPDAKENKGLARYVSEIEAKEEAAALKEAEEMCFLHGVCDDDAKTATAPTAPLASPSPSPASSPVPPEAPVGAPARTPVPYPTSASPSPSPVAAEPPVARTPVPVPSPARFRRRFRMSRRYQRMSQLDA